jgi:hypothetical protein
LHSPCFAILYVTDERRRNRTLIEIAPVVRDVQPNWHTQLFNGSFLHQNAFRQPAGPEVDAAWDALGVNYRSVVIAEDEAKRTGLRHDQVKVSQEYGGGFPANVEGLHHLHCLVSSRSGPLVTCH